MASLFTTDFFVGNRRRLRQNVAPGTPIIVTANGLLQRNGDATFKFRQDSSFWYLSGIDEPDVTLVIDDEHEYLIVPSRDKVREAFDGVVETSLVSDRSGITEVLDDDAGWHRLSQRLATAKTVATLVPAPMYIQQAGMYVNPARERLVQRLYELDDSLEMIDLREVLAELRSVKQPPELTALRRAIDITIDGLEAAASPKALKSYDYEYQAEIELIRFFRLHGASGHAFEPIVSAGKRSCTLHNLAMDGPVYDDQLLQFDVGAEFEHYAADISRSYAVGKPSPRQQAVHRAVCEVQDYALTLLKPGVLLKDYEHAVSVYLGEKLVALGLIDEVTDEAVRRFYPHAASHYLGLDVHDAGPYHQPLAAGMVVTCEPGIYIPEEGIGIRIEDDVLITDDGCEVLSKRLSRALA